MNSAFNEVSCRFFKKCIVYIEKTNHFKIKIVDAERCNGRMIAVTIWSVSFDTCHTVIFGQFSRTHPWASGTLNYVKCNKWSRTCTLYSTRHDSTTLVSDFSYRNMPANEPNDIARYIVLIFQWHKLDLLFDSVMIDVPASRQTLRRIATMARVRVVFSHLAFHFVQQSRTKRISESFGWLLEVNRVIFSALAQLAQSKNTCTPNTN